MEARAKQHFKKRRRFGGIVAVLAFFSAWLPGAMLNAAEVVVTEPQVKALCLLNFAKYVTWPETSFTATNSPIRIGVIGDSKIHDELTRAAQGKTVNGRPVEVAGAGGVAEIGRCHILFVSGSDKARVRETIAAVRSDAVLTVGEGSEFVEGGGMIVFVKRDNKVRFEVNLAAARAEKLKISSKLLALADAVRGKGEAE